MTWTCPECGRHYDDIDGAPCPSDDCPSHERETAEERVLRQIKSLGNYTAVKYLPDGSIAAIGSLMFTTAVFLGCNLWGWDRRFCFQDTDKAWEQFASLKTEDDELVGWIARRPEQPCR